MKFVEKTEINQRDAINQLPPVDVQGTLLVGEESILKIPVNHSDYGYDIMEVFPAYKNGEKAWLFTYDWKPAYGYSAEGFEDVVKTFEDGAMELLKLGAYGHLFQNKDI